LQPAADMPRLVLAGVTMVAVVTLARPARADGAYFGLGAGAARLDGDLDRLFDTSGEVGGRFIGGLRFDDTALEVSFFGTDLHDADAGLHGSYSTFSLGLGLKQYVPLNDRISIYGRVGLDHTWLKNLNGGLRSSDLSGRGFDLGTGMQIDWRWHWGRDASRTASASLWLDVGQQRLRLEDPDRDRITGRIAAVNLGFTFQLGW